MLWQWQQQRIWNGRPYLMQLKTMHTVVLVANMLDFISASAMPLSVIHLDDSWQEKLISLKSTSQLPPFFSLNTEQFEALGNKHFPVFSLCRGKKLGDMHVLDVTALSDLQKLTLNSEWPGNMWFEQTLG